MKKFLIGAAQFISYVVIYEIVVWAVYILASLLYAFVNRFSIFKIILPDIAMEGIIFTTCPMVCGFIIVYLMGAIFKKTGLYLVSTILMLMMLSYTNISKIVSSVFEYGIISWNFANIVWQSVILCGIIIVGLLGLSGYDLFKKKDNES